MPLRVFGREYYSDVATSGLIEFVGGSILGQLMYFESYAWNGGLMENGWDTPGTSKKPAELLALRARLEPLSAFAERRPPDIGITNRIGEEGAFVK
jgi:hypothetical protein